MAIIELHLENPYDVSFQRFLNSYHPDLLDHPELIVEIELAKGHEVLSGLIELACQCSHIRNIQLGRVGIWALPTKWVLEHIEEVAEPILQENDEWEYRRLLEVYWHIDKLLTRKFALRCLEHHDFEIQELGQECLEKLNELFRNRTIEYWE